MNPHGLSGVHAGATTQADNPIRPIGQHLRRAAPHRLQRGVWFHLGKDLTFQARGGQLFLHDSDKSKFLDDRIGDNEGAFTLNERQLCQGIFTKRNFRTAKEPHKNFGFRISD